MYARYERGANEMPIHRLITICKVYNISADYLLGTTPVNCAGREGSLVTMNQQVNIFKHSAGT